MKFALPMLLPLVVLLSACDETVMVNADGTRAVGSSSLSSAGTSDQRAASVEMAAVDRARPAEIDASKYTMIVPVDGPDFLHVLFKSPAHAQEAGYCVSHNYGAVTKVIQASDPRTRQSFYFIECEKTDPSSIGLEDRIAALEAQQPAWDARTAEMRAEADAAVLSAGEYVDPYANCPIGQGGFPIVRDDCVRR